MSVIRIGKQSSEWLRVKDYLSTVLSSYINNYFLISNLVDIEFSHLIRIYNLFF